MVCALRDDSCQSAKNVNLVRIRSHSAPEFHPLAQQSICFQVVSGTLRDLEYVGISERLFHVTAQRQQERSRDEPQQRSAGGSGFGTVMSA